MGPQEGAKVGFRVKNASSIWQFYEFIWHLCGTNHPIDFCLAIMKCGLSLKFL